MTRIVSFQDRLIEDARACVQRGRYHDAALLLERIIHHPRLNPVVAAEANYLLAQVRFACADSDGAEESARRAVQADVDNPDYHFVLAEALEEEGASDEALKHFATAARLSPDDHRKVLRYACAIAKQKDPVRGLRLMQTVYSQYGDNPEVVATVVEGLVAHDRLEEAELIVRQAMYRHGHNERFRRIRDRFRSLRCEMLLVRRAKGSDGSSATIPYINPSIVAMAKPGGAKRPDRGDDDKRPVKSARSPRPVSMQPIAIDEGMTTVEILRRSGGHTVASIYDSLGLLGKEEMDTQIREIACFLADSDSLARVVRVLPPATRKLLKTLVQLGGYVPATTLFQTTSDPNAPPPDYAQPLIMNGLAVFGRTTRNSRRPLVVAIPVDLLGRLARILKVKGPSTDE